MGKEFNALCIAGDLHLLHLVLVVGFSYMIFLYCIFIMLVSCLGWQKKAGWKSSTVNHLQNLYKSSTSELQMFLVFNMNKKMLTAQSLPELVQLG